jgi:hypothetical protein
MFQWHDQACRDRYTLIDTYAAGANPVTSRQTRFQRAASHSGDEGYLHEEIFDRLLLLVQ